MDMDIDDYEGEYEKLRRELLPLELGPHGPYWEIFDVWQDKFKAARADLLEKYPEPSIWNLTVMMIHLHLFNSDIEKMAWKQILAKLTEFFGGLDPADIPIRLTW